MRRALLLLAVAVIAVGCGENNKVGNESLLNFKDQANTRLGAATPTPVPVAVTPAPAGNGPVKAAVAATPTPATKKVDESQISITININSDSAGATTSFDPAVARVFVNSQVRWINKDSVRRSVESDTDAFDSGMINPGGEWVYQFKSAGKFNYHDGTRPYAVAAVEVIAR